MGQKLSAPHLALYRAVDEVLHYVWDLIGASAFPQARNEYHRPAVCLQRQAS